MYNQFGLFDTIQELFFKFPTRIWKSTGNSMIILVWKVKDPFFFIKKALKIYILELGFCMSKLFCFEEIKINFGPLTSIKA